MMPGKTVRLTTSAAGGARLRSPWEGSLWTTVPLEGKPLKSRVKASPFRGGVCEADGGVLHIPVTRNLTGNENAARRGQDPALQHPKTPCHPTRPRGNHHCRRAAYMRPLRSAATSKINHIVPTGEAFRKVLCGRRVEPLRPLRGQLPWKGSL